MYAVSVVSFGRVLESLHFFHRAIVNPSRPHIFQTAVITKLKFSSTVLSTLTSEESRPAKNQSVVRMSRKALPAPINLSDSIISYNDQHEAVVNMLKHTDKERIPCIFHPESIPMLEDLLKSKRFEKIVLLHDRTYLEQWKAFAKRQKSPTTINVRYCNLSRIGSMSYWDMRNGTDFIGKAFDVEGYRAVDKADLKPLCFIGKLGDDFETERRILAFLYYKRLLKTSVWKYDPLEFLFWVSPSQLAVLHPRDFFCTIKNKAVKIEGIHGLANKMSHLRLTMAQVQSTAFGRSSSHSTVRYQAELNRLGISQDHMYLVRMEPKRTEDIIEQFKLDKDFKLEQYLFHLDFFLRQLTQEQKTNTLSAAWRNWLGKTPSLWRSHEFESTFQVLRKQTDKPLKHREKRCNNLYHYAKLTDRFLRVMQKVDEKTRHPRRKVRTNAYADAFEQCNLRHEADHMRKVCETMKFKPYARRY